MPAFSPTPPPPRPSKTLDLALAVAAVAWFLAARELAARSASGISQRLDLLALASVLQPLFLLFLLVVGFSVLDLIARRRSSTRDLLGLPQRPTSREEFGIGAAVGWSAILLSLLPIVLFGSLRIQLWTEPRAFLYALLTLAGAALTALALEITFRGYAFRRLVESIGPTGATLSMALLYGLLFAFSPGSTGVGVLVLALLGILLSIGWLRTHALWLSWGLNFAWTASLGLLFGLPSAGSTDLSAIVQTTAVGRRLLTGGDFGPEAAPFTVVALLLAIAVLVRVTRNYAWIYTHAPIVAGGYPVDVPPPAAHNAMAAPASAPAPPPLVQILPSTPQQRSVVDPPL
ncbi:MAG: hypothetical protein NVSMB3_04230 [Acidobacteriaceae bacterium]